MIGRGLEIGARQPAETLTAVLLAVSAVHIVFNETLANWQALWTCAAFVLLAVILERARGARG
jgi:glucan 1,3-beta-glucosidase